MLRQNYSSTAPARRRSTRHSAPAFISGFGTVVQEENELHQLTDTARAWTAGRRGEAGDLARVLSLHLEQIKAIITLLGERQNLYPQSARFGVLLGQTSFATRGWRQARIQLPATPRGFLARHERIIASLRALIGPGTGGPEGEPLLSEAAHRHEDMVRALMALVGEDQGAPAPLSSDR